MLHKFVVRLLGRETLLGDSGPLILLAWAEVQAEPRPQSRGASCPFWAVAPTLLPIEQKGVATHISIHWCELDIARLADVPQTPVEPGQVLTQHWLQPVWLTAGMQNVPLPPVTVRAPVTLNIAPAVLGAAAP